MSHEAWICKSADEQILCATIEGSRMSRKTVLESLLAKIDDDVGEKDTADT
jgi:hypothetical protein